MAKPDPLYVLRKTIRDAKKQFRHNTDNSSSLFHPAKGFVLAYDIREVEKALNEYEMSLPSELDRKSEKG